MLQGQLKSLEQTAKPINNVLAPLASLKSGMARPAGERAPCSCHIIGSFLS